MSVCILILKGLNWLKELIVWSWTYLWAAWFVLVCKNISGPPVVLSLRILLGAMEPSSKLLNS